MTFVCAGCGDKLSLEETKGSMKHPYCAKCFKNIWDDDYTKYVRWLNTNHLFC